MMDKFLELKVAMAKRQSEAGYGRARIDNGSRRHLGLDLGDVIEIIGKRVVVAKIFKGESGDDGMKLIRIDGPTRTSAGVSVDETVRIRKCDPHIAAKVVLSPNISDGKRINYEKGTENIFRNGLIGRPLMTGTDLMIPNIALMGNRATYSVTLTVPDGPVLVGPETEIILRNESSKKESETCLGHTTYDDIGGLDDELQKIREMIELPLKHPELFDRMGISAPKGVLLYGPPGTGKTLIAEAVANESGASFYSIRGPEIMGRYYGQSEERLRKVFEEAEDNAPSIIFLDEIDSIAPNRDSTYGEVERRVVAQLLTMMDGMGGRGDVIVIGATNREDSIDPALRRPGRFDREIEIGVPNVIGRKSILEVHTRDMPLSDDVKVEELAAMTHGFVGADLASLARESAMKCLSKRISRLDLDKPVPQSTLETMKVCMSDFAEAFADIEPSGMREVSVEVPKITWDDIGGLEHIRKEIEEVFIPAEEHKSFERLGIEPGKALLLYGPPGTGKTMIAKATANGSGSNFISVSGPEIASKWMGESEQAIRKIFKKAKQMAPSIIFFDEIDSIAPIRGEGDSQAWSRVVAQLLTSMDGIESMNRVIIMAATNRPDAIDPALLRPGRIDRMILVGKPDSEARESILRVHTARMPLKGVDLEFIARATDGYVGADLAALCREAGLLAYRGDSSAQYVTDKNFRDAMDSIGPSVSESVFGKYEALSREMRKLRSGLNDHPFYG
ncbi:MAG: CDC48 family AAA ATPase [Candidatus Methanoplasma sp.]|jgi:transitional endoplasmic reticulum ATPase|nr:CDC48 family AAA ATPase [Candidatus Methanoplasma sp.]